MKMETVMEEGDECASPWKFEEDISQLCRICANSNEYLIPIFQGEGLEHELKNKICKHLPIKVSEGDKLPTNLCYQCASTLIAWHDMVVGCLEADEKLRALAHDDDDRDEIDTQPDDSKTKTITEADSGMERTLVEVAKPEKLEENKIHYLVQQKKLQSAMQKVEVEEEVTTIEHEPELVEEVSSEPRGIIYLKTESQNEDKIAEVIPVSAEEDEVVEVYEDVETSVVLHDFVEGLEEGQYIAYIGDEYIESSVEVMDQEVEEIAEGYDSKPMVCEDCGRVFTNTVLFNTHLNTHQNKGHFCDYCDANYKRIDHLYKHIEIMHPECSVIVREKKPNPYAKTFLCNTCGKILKSSLAYENHTLKHQSKCPFECSLCSETFPNRGVRRKHEVKEHNLLTKGNGNPDGYHVCEICGLEMFSDGAYYHHKDKHGDPYPCGFCGKLYGSRSLMQVHARRHTNERPYVCTTCNRNFKVKQELNAHMNIHKDLRPYQCPHCPKMCRKSSDLTHHIRTHTGEKPFICDKCGRGFAQAGDMRKHRLLHFRPSKVNKNHSS